MDLYKVSMHGSDVANGIKGKIFLFTGQVLLCMNDNIKNSLECALKTAAMQSWLQIIMDVCRVCSISCIIPMSSVFFFPHVK